MFRHSRFASSLSFVLLLSAGCGGSTSPASTTPAAPVLTVSPANSLSFAATTVGQTSATQSFTFTNTGSATLTLGSYSMTGATSSFTETSASTCSTSTSTLAPNASCILVFSFSPQSAGSLTETISAADNTSSPAVMLTLAGTGTSSTVGTAALSPSSLTFPSTAAGSTATAQNVTLTNSGTGPLSLTLPAALSGANPSNFSVFGTSCTATLAAGSSCTFALTFTPAAAGVTYGAVLTVTDNSGNVSGSTQSVSLTGAGSAAAPVALAVFTPASLTFAATTVANSAAPQTVTLSNPGTATLTGIAVAVSGVGFNEISACSATLAPAASCTISVGFLPTAAGTASGMLSVADSATGSPQSVILSGSAVAPQASLSSTAISFPTTQIATTSAAQTVTLTNTGTAMLTGVTISLGGTNVSSFAETTTCGATLAAAGSCTISATFSPTAANNYSATISVASSASATPQAIALAGSGSTTAVTRTMYTFPEADNSATVLYNFVNSAMKTIDMTMYEMQDTIFTADLVAACARGVRVRVVFSSSEASANATAYAAINAGGANCSAVESNSAFTNTHQKTITIDGGLAAQQTAILSLNLQTQYYSTTRDFALIENDPADIAAIEATFNQDYTAGGTNSATEFNYQPGGGDTSVYAAGDLIWSPTTAQPDMLSIINAATKTIVLENEEMSASSIVNALEAACQRGVTVHIAMVASSSYTANFNALTAAGCGVYLYPDTATGFYVHAKAVVADYGLSTQNAYMGSINYSNASMLQNRELGLFLSDPAAVAMLNTVLNQDYTGKPNY
jgi:phosphatidylserine/phosphatidylglycerophosphate/cardiolipin synthase-like enzyme